MESSALKRVAATGDGPLSDIEIISPTEAAAIQSRLELGFSPATLDPGYVIADAARSPGLTPVFLCYRSQGEVWMHGFHLGSVPGMPWRDASSPYGYGGPLASSSDPAFLAAAWAGYRNWMRAQRVVVEYVRFHPLVENERFYAGNVADNRKVVLIDFQAGPCEDGYASRLRSTLRKAGRSGIVFREERLADRVGQFGSFYRSAMRDIGAHSFYEFDDAYFERLARTPLVRLVTCVAAGSGGEDWLAASLLLEWGNTLEYHLAGSSPEGRRVAAASFLLDQAARQAQARGLKVFYLGGGTSPEADNSLLFFKGAFSNARRMYRTGSMVYDPVGYDEIKARYADEWARFPERPIFYRSA